MRSLKGQRALITGMGKGIGKALALALAKEGVHIALLARSTKDIEDVATEVRKLGVEAITEGSSSQHTRRCQLMD